MNTHASPASDVPPERLVPHDAATPEHAETSANDYTAMLEQLGWQDWSGRMARNLQRPPQGISTLLPLRERILRHNIRRYGIYNATRDLAVDVMTLCEDYLSEERDYELDEQLTRQALCELTVRMLLLQPNDPPTELPNYVRHIEDAGTRDDAAYAYDIEITHRNMVEHIQEIVADLMETCYGIGLMEPVQKGRRGETLSEAEQAELADVDIDEIEAQWSRFESLVSQMIRVHYLEPYFAQTPFLGEALLACVMKYALDHEDQPLLSMLYQAAAQNGVNIHNHIGVTNETLLGLLGQAAEAYNAQLIRGKNKPPRRPLDTEIQAGSWVEYTDQWGERVRLPIDNGDILVYRSRTKLAGEIGFAAMPSWKNWRGILRHRLWLGSFTGMLLHLEEDAASDGLDPLERIRGRLQHKHWLVPGYNHTGVAKVFRADIGLQQHRAVDAYPDGGIRIVGLNQFAHNGPQMRFAVVKADPRGFYEHMQRQRAEHGYRETAWEAFVAGYDDKKGIFARAKQAAWPTIISREDFEALHNKPLEAGETDEAVRAWKEQVHARMVDHIIEHYLLDWGVHFATGFINVVGGLYCAQTPVVAMLQANGIDFETHPDHFSLGVKILGLLGLASSIPFESRIVAPSGTYVQPFQTVYGVNFERINPLSQVRAESAPRYTSMSPAMRAALYDPDEESSQRLIDTGADQESGYFWERVAIVSGSADSVRAAMRQVQAYAGFEDRTWVQKAMHRIREGTLWLFGM